MKATLKASSVNQIAKDTIIYEKDDALQSISLIVKGRVTIENSGTKVTVTSGAFLGLHDLFSQTYQATCIAETNCVIYCFPATGEIRDVLTILQTNIDYGSLMVTSTNKYLRDLSRIAEDLHSEAEELPAFLQQSYQAYLSMVKKYGTSCSKITSIDSITPIDQEGKIPLSIETITYYSACCNVPADTLKAYYGADPVICIYHIREQIRLVQELYHYCQAYCEYVCSLSSLLITDSYNLYNNTAKLTQELSHMGISTSEALSCMDDLVDRINSIETLVCDHTGADFSIDRESMEDTYFAALNAESGSSISTSDITAIDEFAGVDPSLLDNSLEQILEFSECDGDTAENFKSLIAKYAGLKDKFSTDDDARKLRKEIAKAYYPLYHQVFLKDYSNKGNSPVAIDWFLRYGFLSEKLLSEEHINALFELNTHSISEEPCRVYDMKEWFTCIYSGEKEPSKNEFDLDYTEYLRDQRKSSMITAAEEKKLAEDKDKKLEFEINNMFRYTHRILSSQPSTFVPFLHDGNCVGILTNAYLAKDKVNAAIRRLLSIDFSVFHREILYTNPEMGIQKEYIMLQVCPDIILLPAFGSNGLMWQELSGKRRNSAGRFILPIFFDGQMLDQIITRLCGRFRWELCRTMQGSSWNNVQVKSLTSEYSDYVQFYRKNHDLSEERKEKLRMQIQKCRNNTREIFTLDYESWIKNESHSALVLTKPVREIMATYCPFVKEIRDAQANQPAFMEAGSRFKRERGKKNREMDLRLRVLEKEGAQIPQELIDTRDFYTL